MEPLLFLSHRIPFPPNKGDKVRSYHLLRFLASRYRIFLATFIDSPEDEVEVDHLKEYCADWMVSRLHRGRARLRSLAGLATGEALTLPYYRSRVLRTWVRSVVSQHRIAKAVVFSSAMAQYVEDLPALTRIVDFVDVDSEKWRDYARWRSWPLSLVYRREGRRLLAYEREVASWADASVFVTVGEATLFKNLMAIPADGVQVITNGVDADYFSPHHEFPSPFAVAEQPIVFTGAMDYWPNVDAARWFASEVLPLVRAVAPAARFYIVGNRPTPLIRALGKRRDVVITGKVPDVRPYLKHAQVVVAPLRIGRGIQNKVLEAMAMAKAAVVSEAAAEGLSAMPVAEIDVACEAHDYARKVLALLGSSRGLKMGEAARERVLAEYDWSSNLERIDELLSAVSGSCCGSKGQRGRSISRPLTAV